MNDASVVNMLVREGKRRGHPISNTMAITTGMEEIGSYSIDASGLHAGLILCTLDRIDDGEWLLKSLRMPFSRRLHIVEQVANLWPSLRMHTTARRPCIEITYCSECESTRRLRGMYLEHFGNCTLMSSKPFRRSIHPF